jgi:hypothetical protein
MYRRNIGGRPDSRRKELKKRDFLDYERIFYRRHYGSEQNESFLRLLACLDFYPALQILRLKEPIKKVRFKYQFPKIDFAELDQAVPNFSKYFVIKTIRATYGLIKKGVQKSGSPIDASIREGLRHIGFYLEDYEFHQEACPQVIDGILQNLKILEGGIHMMGGLAIILGPPRPASVKGNDIIDFLKIATNYLSKLCGRCPQCDVYHYATEKAPDFDQPVSVFRNRVVYGAFQLARKFRQGRALKKNLIKHVFEALVKAPIYGQLQRYKPARRAQIHKEKQRLDFLENPYPRRHRYHHSGSWQHNPEPEPDANALEDYFVDLMDKLSKAIAKQTAGRGSRRKVAYYAGALNTFYDLPEIYAPYQKYRKRYNALIEAAIESIGRAY